MYGITETMRACDLQAPGAEPIRQQRKHDRPCRIPTTMTYIMDAGQRPVPAGRGRRDLHVGGRGVARGYLNRPELTPSASCPIPSCRAGACTARATWAAGWPTANMEYLGRLDHQVKLRGFRIELGEIEAALLRHAGGARRGGAARARTRRATRGWSPTWCRRAGVTPATAPSCARRCCAACPTTWCRRPSCVLDALPLTPNGKVDRAALPAPDSASRGEHHVRRAADARSRRCWPAIWARGAGARAGRRPRQLLRARRPLAAGDPGARAAARGAAASSCRCARCSRPRRVAALALRIGQARAAGDRRCGRTGHAAPAVAMATLPLSFAQQRLWFLDQLGRDSAAYNMPVGAAPAAARSTWRRCAAASNEIVRAARGAAHQLRGARRRPVQVIAPHRSWRWPSST